MPLRKIIVHTVIKSLLAVLCKVDYSALQKVPQNGPLILVGNHINFLDAPVSLTFLYPRPVISLVKEETFDKPILKYLFNTWGSISIKRGTADFKAFDNALVSLESGKILAVSPEGTRTNDGKLIRGQTGIVLLALKSGVPILPVVFYGNEKFKINIKRIKRTYIKYEVGEPFKVINNHTYPSKEERQAITDEIMYQLATLLPEGYRGHYSDLSKATTNYLDYDVDLTTLHYTSRQKISDALGKHFSASEVATE